MNKILVSFIVPVYNEVQNIDTVLKNLHDILSQHQEWHPEVIVIDDGSTDGTHQAILPSIHTYPQIQLITHERNLGYTQSLKAGIRIAKGKFVMYVGADEEFDSSELPTFIEPLLAGKTDVVLGVRWQRNAYKLFRFFLSVIYIFCLNYLFKLRVNDYNWSQAWSRELLNRIDLKSNSLFVLPEIIVKAHDLNYRIKEVPSNHRGRQFGKSSVNLKVMTHALIDALIFWRWRISSSYIAEKKNMSQPQP